MLLLSVCVVLLYDCEAIRNHYEVLGVPMSANDRQVKKAFYKLAMTYHPDRNKRPDAEKTFREMAKAYKVLSDEKMRGKYDQLIHKSLQTEGEYEIKEDLLGDEGGQNFFSLNIEDLFHVLNLDGDHYLEDLGDSWSFQLTGEDSFEPQERQAFRDSSFFELFEPVSHFGAHEVMFREQQEDHLEWQEGHQFYQRETTTDGSAVEE